VFVVWTGIMCDLPMRCKMYRNPQWSSIWLCDRCGVKGTIDYLGEGGGRQPIPDAAGRAGIRSITGAEAVTGSQAAKAPPDRVAPLGGGQGTLAGMGGVATDDARTGLGDEDYAESAGREQAGKKGVKRSGVKARGCDTAMVVLGANQTWFHACVRSTRDSVYHAFCRWSQPVESRKWVGGDTLDSNCWVAVHAYANGTVVLEQALGSGAGGGASSGRKRPLHSTTRMTADEMVQRDLLVQCEHGALLEEGRKTAAHQVCLAVRYPLRH
jgi:hypothetical protein